MNYIWTMWTEPWGAAKPWDLMCYAVSVGLAKKLPGTQMIYTDERGAAWLEEYCVDAPFTVIKFDIAKSSSPKFGEAKLKTMLIQEQPFCHLDHDLFLLAEQKTVPDADIVVQNIEQGPYYKEVYEGAYALGQSQGTVWMSELRERAESNDFKAYNCGYVQVNNMDVMREWCSQAISMSRTFSPVEPRDNAIIEQMSLYALAKARGYSVATLFELDSLTQLGPEMAGYVHFMAAKNDARFFTTYRLIQRAKEVAPAFYKKCFPHLPLA